MKKVIEIILITLLIIGLCALTAFGLYKLVVTTNQRRYKETPLMSEIEERSKVYILGNWLKSGVELEFVTQEAIGEHTLVYYFKVVEPEYFYVYGVREYYVKAVYKWKSTGILTYKSWQFDVVWTSSYEEIQTILEVQDNEKKSF
jgi:hypothetical protein